MYRKILQHEIKLDKTLGYQYFIDKLHPLASSVGKVAYHRHVASVEILERWILPTEIVHHIDHNKLNNLEDNLLVLSNKEHAALHATERRQEDIDVICPVCSTIFLVKTSQLSKRVHCSEKCAKHAQVVWGITKEELEQLIWNKSYVQIAKEYNISDVGAKKRAKSLGCRIPPPYFFNKTENFRREQRKLNNISDLSTQQSSKLLA